MIKFIVPGIPQGKARARTCTSKFTGKVHSFTPYKTVQYENLIKIIAKESTDRYYRYEPLAMVITACYPIPKSTSKKNKDLMLENKIRPTKKPDLDNVAKVYQDALNSVIYHDDSQIVSLVVRKVYAEEPKVEVLVMLVKTDGDENDYLE